MVIRHAAIRSQLHDYLVGGLTPEERSKVEEHLQHCRPCSEFLHDLPELNSLWNGDPSLQRSAEYWHSFPLAVETKLGEAERQQPPSRPDRFRPVRVDRRRMILAACGAVALMFFILFFPRHEESGDRAAVSAPPPDTTSAMRVNRYLQRSKILLVGITNLPTGPDLPLDLGTEQKASRELAEEAKVLKRHPLDIRTARLIDDLERIQNRLANMSTGDQRQDLSLARDGIRQENLLFKVRMAESLYDRPLFEPGATSRPAGRP
jgi:predicted anti-sigma-YlaC factor YlaD